MPELMDANAVVRAGGVARKGAKTDPATTGDLVAKSFVHPAMEGRVVVRLVEQSLEPAVDAEMQVLGFQADGAGESVLVGRTKKRALGFPAWALVNHPNKARFALEVMKDFRKAASRARTKPGHAKDAFMVVAKKLERSVPPFMPSYWEEVGRVFLDQDATMYASQSFEKARAAEREYKLSVDEDRRAGAYLEFTAAGAVPAKSLAGYAEDLLSAFGAKEAERRFFELNVHRVKAGVPPWTGMAKELGKLAASAKRADADAAFLREVLASPSLKKAPPDFWSAYGPTLVTMAKASPEILQRVLWLFPEPRGFRKFVPSWLALLDEVGAVQALTATEATTRAEAGRWLSALTRFVTYSDEYGSRKDPLPDLYFSLFARLAPSLLRLGEPVEVGSYRRWGDGEYSPDILEAVLDAGLTIAPPKGEIASIDLGDAFVRDPVRLAAHAEYAPLLETAVGGQFGRDEFEARAKGKAGLVTARRNYLMGLIADLAKAALPALKGGLETLTEKTSAATFAEFPEALAAVERLDVTPALARTLRAGIFDELTWPEFEAALASLAGPKVEIALHGTMQNPILLAGRKVVVFDGRAVLRELDLPAVVKDPSEVVFLDGDLLVSFYDRKNHLSQAVWASDAKNPFTTDVQLRGIHEALPVPGGAGGVTLGGACIHCGDRPEKIQYAYFASDGASFWSGRMHWQEPVKLLELDPKTGAQGRASWPAMVREASERADSFYLQEVQLMPAPRGAERSLLGVRDGLVGHFVRRDLTKSRFELTRIDGKTRTGDSKPAQLIDWPGREAPVALAIDTAWRSTNSDEISLWDDEGEATATFGGDEWPSAGWRVLPREPWLHYLTVRNDASSRALRNVTDDAVAKVLAVEDDEESLAKTIDAIKTHLPGVTNEVIRGGIAHVVKVARDRVQELVALKERGAGGGGTVSDDALHEALPLLDSEGYEDGFAGTDMKLVGDAFRDGKRGKLTASRMCWEQHVESLAKLACLVASRGTTDAATRNTLIAFLHALGESRLFGLEVTRAELVVKTGSPFLVRPKGKDVWLASEGDALFFARLPDEDEDEPTQKVSVLVRGALSVPKDATLVSKEAFAIPDDGALVTAFLRELEARGPSPYDPTAAPFVAAETTLTVTDAALILVGLPSFGKYQHDFLGKELRATLDLKVTDANRAKDKLKQLPDGQLLALLIGASGVREPADFWAPAAEERSVARALITRAKALFGKNVVLREELVTAIEKDFRLDVPVRKALTLLLTVDDTPPLLVARKPPIPWDDLGDTGEFFSGDVVEAVSDLLPYLAFVLPVGDEYRQRLPSLHRAVTKLLRDPAMLLSMGSRYEYDDKKRGALLEQIGGKKFTVKAKEEEHEARDNGTIVAIDSGSHQVDLSVRTARIASDRAAILPFLTQEDGDSIYGTGGAIAALYLMSKECEALVARIEKTPVSEGSYEGNPALSAKGTVKKLAAEISVDDETATLYLQMLALPNPTKKLILRLNAWKPAQYGKAASALVKKKLCIEGKRERAGRDLFLPGSWEKKTRGVSIETYKLALYDLTLAREPAIRGAVHTLYEKAFERWSSGDRPGFVDVTMKKT